MNKLRKTLVAVFSALFLVCAALLAACGAGTNARTKTYSVAVDVNDGSLGTYAMTAANSDGGDYVEGTEVTLTVTPADGYEASLKINGVEVELQDNTYTFEVAADTSIQLDYTYKYAVMTYVGAGEGEITLSAPANGEKYVENEKVTVTLAPAQGYATDVFKVNGKDTTYSPANTCEVTVTGKTYVYAEFVALHTLTVENDGEKGDVTVNGAPYTAALTLKEGAAATVKVAPKAGETVKAVYVNGGLAIPDANGEIVVTVKKDTAVKVVYDEYYTVTLPEETDGVHVSLSSPAEKYLAGTVLTLTVTVDDGYRLDTVTVGGKEVSLKNHTYTFTVDSDLVVAVTVSQVKYTVTVTRSNDALGDYVLGGAEAQEGKYAYGDEVTLTVTPAVGYQVKTLYVNGDRVSYSGEYAFTVKSDVEIHIEFSSLPRHRVVVAYNESYGEVSLSEPAIGLDGKYYEGETVTLTVHGVRDGYVAYIAVDGGETTAVVGGTYTLTMGKADVHVAITFEAAAVLDPTFRPETEETLSYVASVEDAPELSVTSEGALVLDGAEVDLAEVEDTYYFDTEEASYTLEWFSGIPGGILVLTKTPAVSTVALLAMAENTQVYHYYLNEEPNGDLAGYAGSYSTKGTKEKTILVDAEALTISIEGGTAKLIVIVEFGEARHYMFLDVENAAAYDLVLNGMELTVNGDLYEQSTYSVTIEGEHVTADFEQDGPYDPETDVVFTLEPDAGYVIKSVSVKDGETLEASDGKYTVHVVGKDLTVIVVTEALKPQFTVELGGGALEGDAYTLGALENGAYTVTLTDEIPTLAGYRFDKWTVKVNGQDVEVAEGTFSVTLANEMKVEITAEYVRIYTVTLGEADQAALAEFSAYNVTKNAALQSGGVADTGDQIKITVKANENYKVKSVKVGGNVVELDGDGTHTFTLESDVTVEVGTCRTYTVTVTIREGEELGHVTITSGEIEIHNGDVLEEGAPVKIVVGPSAGNFMIAYKVFVPGSMINVNAADGEKKNSDIDNVGTDALKGEGAIEVDVKFVKGYTVTFEKKAEADALHADAALVDSVINYFMSGEEVKFTVTAHEGYKIVSVKNGENVIEAQDGVYSLTVGTENIVVTIETAVHKIDHPYNPYVIVEGEVVKLQLYVQHSGYEQEVFVASVLILNETRIEHPEVSGNLLKFDLSKLDFGEYSLKIEIDGKVYDITVGVVDCSADKNGKTYKIDAATMKLTVSEQVVEKRLSGFHNGGFTDGGDVMFYATVEGYDESVFQEAVVSENVSLVYGDITIPANTGTKCYNPLDYKKFIAYFVFNIKTLEVHEASELLVKIGEEMYSIDCGDIAKSNRIESKIFTIVHEGGKCMLTVSEDTAEFPVHFTVSGNVEGCSAKLTKDGGTAVSDGESVKFGTVLTLTLEYPENMVAEVTVTGGEKSGSGKSFTVTVNAETTITVTFSVKPATLDIKITSYDNNNGSDLKKITVSNEDLELIRSHVSYINVNNEYPAGWIAQKFEIQGSLIMIVVNLGKFNADDFTIQWFTGGDAGQGGTLWATSHYVAGGQVDPDPEDPDGTAYYADWTKDLVTGGEAGMGIDVWTHYTEVGGQAQINGQSITITYTATDAANWWGEQLFYKNSKLKGGVTYTLICTITVNVACTVKLNDNRNIVLKNGANKVRVVYNGSETSFDFQMGNESANKIVTGENVTFTISDVVWYKGDWTPED